MEQEHVFVQDDCDIAYKDIKKQKRFILAFPINAAFGFLYGVAVNNGHMPQLYVYVLIIIFAVLPNLYAPIVRGILLSKTFYSIEIMDNNQVQFTAFGTLWREEKTITVDLKDIIVDTTPLPKLLYKKYVLNNIYIDNKKYYIFNTILNESGIAAIANNKN